METTAYAAVLVLLAVMMPRRMRRRAILLSSAAWLFEYSPGPGTGLSAWGASTAAAGWKY